MGAMRALRRLASWLIRGPDAELIRGDLEELWERDVGRGMPRWRASLRYGRNLLGSWRSTWRLRPGGRGGLPSWLDFKLGARMLVKYPGLTVLGGLAMAFAIFVGAAAFEFTSQVLNTDLPLPEGDRVVGIRAWDAERSGSESRLLYDLSVWREELESLETVGATRGLDLNLVDPSGVGGPVTAAAMEAAGFRVARVPPEMGRWLTDADAVPGAPPVVVISHDLWRSRFDGDPDVVGTVVRLGDAPTTVVGVMPEGYGFPVAQEAWVPLDTRAGAIEPRKGPGVMVFGRLATGFDMEAARRELEVVGARLAAAHPATHEHLRPQLLPWGRAVLGIPASFSSLALTAIGLASNIPLVLFLVLICGNVALLMFARASSRESELLMRSALGASRRRLVIQLFAEALVLASAAAVLGLVAANYAVSWLLRITRSIALEGDSLPFWFHGGLSPSTIAYAGVLAVIAAAVAGVMPGLKVTRSLAPRLQAASAGGGGFRFGGVWTVVIVLQIAITMIFPLFTLLTRAQSRLELVENIDLASHEYVGARLVLDPPAGRVAPDDSAAARLDERFAAAALGLRDRLLSDPRVAGIAFTERLPRQYHPWREIEVDGPTAKPRFSAEHRLGSTTVSPDYFDVMNGEIVAGRGFSPSDADGRNVVVVNQSFVEIVLGGRSAVGQRLRYMAWDEDDGRDPEPGPWHEIIGVVEDLGTVSGYGHMGVYHTAPAGQFRPAHMVVHVRGDPRTFMPAIRTAATGLDPGLQLHDVITLDEVTRGQREFFAFWETLIVAVSAVALLLSLGGIFAVMSFTVARRTREIGIRVALGSSHARVLASVFRRPLRQIGLGLLVGGLVIGAAAMSASDVLPRPLAIGIVAAYVLAMAAICALACLGPALRALAVEPGEALRAEG